ncbi:hypothetical protein BURPS1710b_2029 [Burkholderia pseudomallei 1710b]|uniref:Uncharacterized protein n=1 Tax=Burkholderia pseudomallei (strain 1710b) TaxID=320372 RepID=Q3JSN0_BURP1|nr:hypothetical protein BURPS1710b_2029 [Burkholderia pseudomallei 1710b]
MKSTWKPDDDTPPAQRGARLRAAAPERRSVGGRRARARRIARSGGAAPRSARERAQGSAYERCRPQTVAVSVRLDVRADRGVRHPHLAGRGAVRARHLSDPARADQRRADDGRVCVGGNARELPSLVVRQALPVDREELPPRADGARVRDRHQLEPVHRVSDGREHDDDAGARHRARGVRAQLVLQGQLPVPAVDRRARDHRLSRVREELRRRMRGALRARSRRGTARLVPRADELRRRPLQAAAEAVAREGIRAQARARGVSAVAGQRAVAHAAREEARVRRRGAGRALSARAAGKPAVFRGEERAVPRTVGARGDPDRAQDRPVLLSAAADAGDERGLGDVLALHAAQHDVQPGQARGRLHDGVPPFAQQRDLPAARDEAVLQRDQSVRARLFDDERHPPDLRGADRRGPQVVPRARGQPVAAGAPLCDAQLQGRELHRAIPVAASDPRDAPVLGARRRHARRARGVGDPRRFRLSVRAAGVVAAVRHPSSRAEHPGVVGQHARRPQPHAAPLHDGQPASVERQRRGAQAHGAALAVRRVPRERRRDGDGPQALRVPLYRAGNPALTDDGAARAGGRARASGRREAGSAGAIEPARPRRLHPLYRSPRRRSRRRASPRSAPRASAARLPSRSASAAATTAAACAAHRTALHETRALRLAFSLDDRLIGNYFSTSGRSRAARNFTFR